jgi:hypothetical protein
VHVIYALDGIGYKTQSLPVIDFEGSYNVSREGNDIILNTSTSDFPDNQVVVNVRKNVAQAVNVYITLGGDNVYPPQLTSPGDSQIFSIAGDGIYLSRTKPEIEKGYILIAEELSSNEMQIQPGQTVSVNGDVNSGYVITVKTGLYTAPANS